MEKADIGLIGLGVMGQNLALNLAGKGWKAHGRDSFFQFLNGSRFPFGI